jgi:3D (Asp-Asp-Asp) domain-containing protein
VKVDLKSAIHTKSICNPQLAIYNFIVIIARSLWRKGAVTVVAVGGFVSLYEVTTLDSRYAARQATLREATALPAPGVRLAFSATAYCKGVTTASGVAAQSGVAAADPELLPVGSVVEVDADDPRYSGIYAIMDTGPAVQGRHVDIYMWSCNEALRFGRRPIHLTVLRLGWSPRATSPNFMERLFSSSEPAPLPSRPLPVIHTPKN